MISYRLDIKKGNVKLPVIYPILKWTMAAYVVWALFFLLNKSYHLVILRITGLPEWLAVIVNLLLIVLLTRQILRLNEKKYIIVTDEYIKFRKRFPWPYRISWKRLKQVQFGYSSVRFIVKKGNKYRFSLVKVSPEEQLKLYEVLESIGKKYGVELMQPL